MGDTLEVKEHKEEAARANEQYKEQFAEMAENPQSAPQLDRRVQVPKSIQTQMSGAFPRISETYHGPYDRGTLQPYTNAAEMPYGVQVFTAQTAKQVNNKNAKRRRQGYIMYDDLTKEWTHIKKKDIPTTKSTQMSAVFEQAFKRRRIAEDAGADDTTTNWERQMKKQDAAAAVNPNNHANTQQPGNLSANTPRVP